MNKFVRFLKRKGMEINDKHPLSYKLIGCWIFRRRTLINVTEPYWNVRKGKYDLSFRKIKRIYQ